MWLVRKWRTSTPADEEWQHLPAATSFGDCSSRAGEHGIFPWRSDRLIANLRQLMLENSP